MTMNADSVHGHDLFYTFLTNNLPFHDSFPDSSDVKLTCVRKKMRKY